MRTNRSAGVLRMTLVGGFHAAATRIQAAMMAIERPNIGLGIATNRRLVCKAVQYKSVFFPEDKGKLVFMGRVTHEGMVGSLRRADQRRSRMLDSGTRLVAWKEWWIQSALDE
ncbi:hypothetical protein DL93DRAFT_1691993 [Clavulina sp. PMI_390]|nr:hypothetical protein DL93DRAFT_1691993 [Clavulina sp. PMI_390]